MPIVTSQWAGGLWAQVIVVPTPVISQLISPDLGGFVIIHNEQGFVIMHNEQGFVIMHNEQGFVIIHNEQGFVIIHNEQEKNENTMN